MLNEEETVKRLLSVLTGLLLLAACGTAATPPSIELVAPEDLPTRTFTNPALEEGRYLYNYHCAHCHGFDGEGQLAATIGQARELGLHLVPPQDSTGHTWEHPDYLLIRVIEDGIPNPLMQFPMPSYKGVMSEQEIRNILSYIRLWWTEPQRAHQQAVTRRWAEIQQQFAVDPTLVKTPAPPPTTDGS